MGAPAAPSLAGASWRHPPVVRSTAPRDHGAMNRCIAFIRHTASAPRETLQVWMLMGLTLVVSSLDQCTRGPSITCMVLAQLHSFF
jgi:hypothetical protein